MRDGLPSKIGDWYEEGYVVLQLLLLLSEQVRRVKWEPVGVEGVDLVVTGDGREVAVQCKHRAKGSWTWKSLGEVRGGNSVLGHARTFLEGGPSRRYRLVTDRPAPGLESLIGSVRATANATDWWQANHTEADKLALAWQLTLDANDAAARTHSLLGRMRVEISNQEPVERECRTLARLLLTADAEVDRLLEILRFTARRSAADRQDVGIADLRAAIEEAGLTLQPRAFSPNVHDSLTRAAGSYRDSVAEVRFLEHISRSENEEVWRAVASCRPGGTVLIHGPAGCGKTEIIVALSNRLGDEGWVALLTTPDRLGDLGLGEDPLAALRRHAAGRPVVIVLDQLDGVLWGGPRTRELLNPVRDLLRRARDLGVMVIAGCRSADARGESELRRMLSGGSGEAPVAVAVGDLPEADYAPVLAGAGLALAELDPQARRLASRPLYLRLMRTLLDRGVDLRKVGGLSSLMNLWWEQLDRELEPRHVAGFDKLVDCMEKEGRLAIRAAGFDDPGCLRALEASGLITIEEGNGPSTVRPTHQILADMRIAHRWRRESTPTALVERLGTRSEQSFHTGRRLRLTIPLLRDHPRAAECLEAIVAADTVRPLVKHAVFRGLAEIDDPRDGEVSLLMRWLQDPVLRTRVASTVVMGSAAWVEALDAAGFLDQLRTSGHSGERDLVLEILASVCESWGDGVARRLRQWSEAEPEVLDRADRMFLHQPGRDTDALFEMRLESYARGSVRSRYVAWEPLLLEHPERAVRLLAALLPGEGFHSPDREDQAWVGFPSSGSKEMGEAARIGALAWDHLAPWWSGLSGVDLRRLRVGSADLPEGLLVRVVDLLARCLARALDRGEFTWSRLVEDLPRPLRDLDGWLLLRVGACLEVAETSAPDAALLWLRSEERWVNLEIGSEGLPWDLSGELVRTASRLATDEACRDLEDWILDYRDRWTPEDELRRWRDHREYGRLRPSKRGALAYHLLPCLPEDRRSLRGSTLLDELRRKYDAVREVVFFRSETKGGLLGSPVPPEVARRWSPAEWIAKLTEAPERGKWAQADPHSVAVFERSTLLSQLFEVARRAPRRYLAHARAFASVEMDEGVAARARQRLLVALSLTSPPDGAAAESAWEPLTDDEIASVLGLDVYLADAGCAVTVARVVRKRPSHAWPGRVLNRLTSIAEAVSDRPAHGPDETGLQFDRLNDDSTIAMEALAAVASHQEEHRGTVLDLAERLVGHENPARRASAAIAAWVCRGLDETRAEAALLRGAGDPLVATEHDVCSYLLFLACGEPADTPAGLRAKAILLALAGDPRPRVADWGGQVQVVLRKELAIGDDAISVAAAGSVEVRRGMARMAAKYLADGHGATWLEQLAIRLADDEGEAVGGEIARVFAYPGSDHLLDRKEFITSLIDTRAVERAPRDLLDACDRRAELTPVRRWVLGIAERLASGAASQETTERWMSEDATCGLLSRLAEEAERNGDMDLRSRALDAWDGLIERGVYHALRQLEDRWRGA